MRLRVRWTVEFACVGWCFREDGQLVLAVSQLEHDEPRQRQQGSDPVSRLYRRLHAQSRCATIRTSSTAPRSQ